MAGHRHLIQMKAVREDLREQLLCRGGRRHVLAGRRAAPGGRRRQVLAVGLVTGGQRDPASCSR